ncbi:MAG: type II secretion system protein [Patescibacteria group bacterium]
MKAFTLVETLVATSIIAIAITAPLFTANRSIIAAQTSSMQLTASSLAQEGIEQVRRLRDNEYLAAYQARGTNISDTAWTRFKTNDPLTDVNSIKDCISPNICTVDPIASGATLSKCVGTCQTLYLHSTTGIYSQQSTSGWVKQPYTRTIQAFDVSPTDLKVVSTVSWNYHGTDFSIAATLHLTPWQ